MENRGTGFRPHREAVLSTVIAEVENELIDVSTASSVFIDNGKDNTAV